MLPQFDNKVMSSMLLWLDHTILQRGRAFTNYGSRFYNQSQVYSNIYTYALPFKQVVADASVGANLLTGVYINGTFVTTGVSGLLDINYEEGHAYFTGNMNSHTLSGNYAIKDFNVYLTNEPDSKILFEQKFYPKTKVNQILTGLAVESQVFPAIFLRNEGRVNEPFAFGGLDETKVKIRAIVLSDDQFKLDALSSIISDRVRTYVPIFEASDMPFNQYGGYKSGSYNYDNIMNSKDISTFLYISEVNISKFNQQSVMSELRETNPDIFPAVIDIEVCSVRTPRV
jgi:hypothetical protein